LKLFFLNLVSFNFDSQLITRR